MTSDVRNAFRSIRRDRTFTLLSVGLLALTIGATAAVYAVVDAVLLRPLAFVDQDELVVIWATDSARSSPTVELALGDVQAWQEHSTMFDALGVFTPASAPVILVADESRTRVSSSWVSASFFDLAGVPPLLGRTLDARDEVDTNFRTVVISHRLWNRRFGSDPAVVGRMIRVRRGTESAELALEIVGVMPEAFDFPYGVDVWLPAAPGVRASARPDPNNPEDVAWFLANYRTFYAIGRLKDGITAPQAAGDLTRIIRQLQPARRTEDVTATPIHDYVVGPAKTVLWTMLAGAGMMLLLACSSVAGLQLFRAAREDRAIAIQLALGASRRQLIRRALTESVLLSIMGVIAAVGVAWITTKVLVLAAPLDVPRLATTSIGTPAVLIVMAGLATLTAVLSGVWPALFIGHVNAGPTLTAGERTAMHPRERLLQRIIVGGQIAVAVVLLSGAGLFVRSVQRLNEIPLGFEPEDLVSIDLQPSAANIERWDQFYDAVRARIGALPGVQGTGAISSAPLRGPIGNDTVPILKGQEGAGADAPWRSNPRVNLQTATPGLFGTLGTRLIGGRDFTDDDRQSSVNVVIVSESTAARYWPGRDPIGQLMLVASQRKPGSVEEPNWQTVIGVVADVRYRGIIDPRLDVYLPAAQSSIRVRQLLVRTSAAPAQVAADVQTVARQVDPAVVVGDVTPMIDAVTRAMAPWQFSMRVLTAFGILAALVAAVGLVGLLGLVVTLRKRELSIRAALGASPQRVRAHLLTESAGITTAATIAGVAIALAVWRLLGSFLIQTPPYDPVALAAAAIVTFVAAMVACVWPAAHATAQDPAAILNTIDRVR